LWLIWLRTGGEKQLVFASRFLTQTGIGLSEVSFDLAFGCWGNSTLIFDVQGIGGLTNLWLVDKGRRVVCFGIDIFKKDFPYISLTFCLSFIDASLRDVMGGVCNVLLFP
jgi:hypothetical protein